MPQDRRSLLSRRLLKDSLIELMKTRSLHEISVKKLCETADVNRSTFYRYYESPYELYDEILEDVGRDIRGLIDRTPEGPARIRGILTDVLTYVEQNRPLILVLLSDRGNVGVGERLSGIISEMTENDNRTELFSYCTQFISAGLINIVWLWLNKEERRPPKEMAALVNALLLHGVARAAAFSTRQ